MIRRWLRRFAWVQAVSASAVVLYLAAAAAGGLLGNGAPVAAQADGTLRVGLFVGTIHADLLIPVTPRLRQQFAFLQDAGVPIVAPEAEWLMVGWGAEGFYTAVKSAPDITAALIWRAATGDFAVLRADIAGRIEDFSQINLVSVTPAQLDKLSDAVLDSFALGPAGQRLALQDPGFTPTDSFFAAKGRFSIFRTCNVWVADMFARAGVPFGRWTPAPYSVRLALWRFWPDG